MAQSNATTQYFAKQAYRLYITTGKKEMRAISFDRPVFCQVNRDLNGKMWVRVNINGTETIENARKNWDKF